MNTSYAGGSPGSPEDPTSRDRDESGRARNARPRDELGRPLPHGAAGMPPLPDDLVLAPHDALDAAQRLLDQGRPFQAHEVLEAVWKSAPEPERPLWQGLAQLAVGLTHARRGNTAGAVTVLRRGRSNLAGYAGPQGVDVPGLLVWADAALARLERGDDGTGLGSPTLRRR